jgi:hypothetical protein
MSVKEDSVHSEIEPLDVPGYLKKCPKCHVSNEPIQVDSEDPCDSYLEGKEYEHSHHTMKMRFVCTWCKHNYRTTFQTFNTCSICWGKASNRTIRSSSDVSNSALPELKQEHPIPRPPSKSVGTPLAIEDQADYEEILSARTRKREPSSSIFSFNYFWSLFWPTSQNSKS